MHARQSADNLKVAKFLSPDVHEQVFSLRVLAIKSLDRVLHRSSKLAVGPAELFEQHVAEFWVWCIHADRVHELFDVVVHIILAVACGLKVEASIDKPTCNESFL
jgi:hypothetical protein